MRPDLSNSVDDTALARRACSALRRKREQWIRRYRGYFGDPSRLDDYRNDELYRSSMKAADNMVTEAGYTEPGTLDE